MNFRLTGILFGLVFVSSLALLGVSLYQDEDKGSGGILDTFLKDGVKPDQIDTVEIERADGQKIKFVRQADQTTWLIDSPIKTKAEGGQVSRIIDDLFKARPIPFAELSSSKSTHGLEPAGLKVTLRQGSDRSMTVDVGDVLGGGRSSVAFVTTSDRPDRPIAINRDAVDGLLKDAKASGNAKDLAKWVNEYRTRQIFSVNPQLSTEEINGITLAGRGDDLALTRTADGWRLFAHYDVKANGKDEPRVLDNVDADATGDFSSGPDTFNGVRPLLASITSLQAISSEDYLPDEPVKIAEYGLADGNPDRVKVELKLKVPGQPDRTETAFIGKKVEGSPNKFYVKVPGVPGVIRATAQSGEAILGVLANPTPLRNRNIFPTDINRGQIAAIDITTGGQTAKLRQPPSGFGKWQLFGGPGDPQDANTATINKLLEVLSQPRTVKEFPTPDDANFAGPELKAEVKLWPEMETPDPKADAKTEPRTKGNPITYLFGKVIRDGTGKITEVYVRRILPSGTKADFILPAEIKTAAAPVNPQFPTPTPIGGTETNLLAAVELNRLALLDPRLKDFAPSSASKFAIATGPNTLEVNFDDKADPPYHPAGKWTYTRYPTASPDKKEPPRPADEGETRSILTALATLSAGPFISEARDEAQWTAWGLSPTAPRMKVTVTLKSPPPPVPVPGQPAPEAPKSEDRIFYFGNDVARDSKTYVYARQEGRDAVFLVDKSLFDRLDKLDLRDRTVVRFDRNKVKKVTLAGWFEKTKAAQMVVFEKRPDGSWVYTPVPSDTMYAGVKVASPPIAIDPNKVPMFIGVVDLMHADGFLAGGAKAEYGFAPTEKGLAIAIELEGAPTVQLNIAAGVTLNPDKTIAAYVPPDQATHFVVWLDTAADPSVNPFLIPAGPYKPFKESPSVFGK